MSGENGMKLVQEYKVYLMGIAILEIVFFHSGLALGRGEIFLAFGEGGVDIFFFLSGIGLYHSLSKDKNVIAFYKRRILRLAPAYIPFIICWLGYKLPEVILTYGWDLPGVIKMIWGNILMTEWINGGLSFNWYIQALFWFYLLTPLLFEIINFVRMSSIKKILFLLFVCSWNILFINQHTLIAVSRILVFILGMMVASSEIYEEKTYSFIAYVLFGIGVLWFVFLHYYCEFDFRWNSGLEWYPFSLITPGWCLILAKILNNVKKYKLFIPFRKILYLIGQSTFEIYLIHIWLFKEFADTFCINSNMKWCFYMVFAIIGGALYWWVTATIVMRIKRV